MAVWVQDLPEQESIHLGSLKGLQVGCQRLAVERMISILLQQRWLETSAQAALHAG